MHIKIPLTVMDSRPQTSSYRVKRVHVARMYEDGLRQLADVSEGNIKLTGTQNTGRQESCLRWAGSERYLYELVACLGDRYNRVEHRAYASLFAQPALAGTEKQPCWVGVSDVYNRHQSELVYTDNLDRIYARWLGSDEPLIRTIRDAVTTGEDPSGFLVTCRNLKAGCDPETLHMDGDVLRTMLDQYPLYRISSHEFFQRNRYRDLICTPNGVIKPYLQRTLMPSALQGFLHTRSERAAV